MLHNIIDSNELILYNVTKCYIGVVILFLKSRRRNLGLTQEFVSKKAMISRAGYSMIETGRRRPSPDVAKRIATVLGFPDEWYRLLEAQADGVSAAEK